MDCVHIKLGVNWGLRDGVKIKINCFAEYLNKLSLNHNLIDYFP